MGIETAILAAAVGGTAAVGAAAIDSKSQKNANKTALRQREASEKFIKEQINQARGDIFKLFPSASESRMKGLEAGLNLYGQAYPQMMNTFQQGNVAAQKTLLQGLPQVQNAIMGNAVDMRGLQPLQLQQPGLTMPNVQPKTIGELFLSQQTPPPNPQQPIAEYR